MRFAEEVAAGYSADLEPPGVYGVGAAGVEGAEGEVLGFFLGRVDL